MPIDTISIDDFVSQNDFRMKCEWAPNNPNMQESENMDHWKCVIRRKGNIGSMTLVFSMGMAHRGKEPEVADVLDCLASDASGIENSPSFEDWCSEYGYDTDSRKAEKTFKACEHQSKRLKKLLGEDLYAQLLWHTERR